MTTINPEQIRVNTAKRMFARHVSKTTRRDVNFEDREIDVVWTASDAVRRHWLIVATYAIQALTDQELIDTRKIAGDPEN